LVYLVERWRDAPIPVHPVTTGILGGFVGAFVAPAMVRRPAGAPGRRVTLARGALGAVRVTNYNVALGYILTSVLFCAGAGGTIFFALVEQVGLPHLAAGMAGAAVGLTGAAFLSSLPMLSVDISDNAVTVRRLFRSRVYPHDHVVRWGFETTRGRASHAAPDVDTPFVVELADGTFFETVVGPGKAADLATLITRSAGRTAAPG
jgi:hypothetical protein